MQAKPLVKQGAASLKLQVPKPGDSHHMDTVNESLECEMSSDDDGDMETERE
jgi:hypothetical protein